MKKTSGQSTSLLLITLFILVFVLIFAFKVLVPTGKEYRETREKINVHTVELAQYQKLNDKTLAQLGTLQEKHRSVITAFGNSFNEERFAAQNKKFFQNLKVSKLSKLKDKQPFDLYEVNATSKINSPVVFYNFLDSLSKSDWIIGVNFPIHFQKEGELINSSFTMRVYTLNKDSNESNATVDESNTTEK